MDKTDRTKLAETLLKDKRYATPDAQQSVKLFLKYGDQIEAIVIVNREQFKISEEAAFTIAGASFQIGYQAAKKEREEN